MNPVQPASLPASQARRTGVRPLAATAAMVTAVALFGLAPISANAAVGTTPRVLINEVYGGGGNSGAPINRDFVELVNATDAAVDLNGWSVQYSSATGTAWQVTPLSGTVPAGATWVVGQAKGAGEQPGITVNNEGTIPMSGTAGKVALVQSTTALGGAAGLDTLPEVIDFVGFGSNASGYAGTAPAPGTTNATSVSRSADHANTADNAHDFTTGAPTPVAWASTDPDPDQDPDPEPEPVAAVTIAEVQGTGNASPLVGKTVSTKGVVTAAYPNGGFGGYFIQTPGTGAIDLATHTASDGLFVYSQATADSVAVGSYVQVTGAVSEFNGMTQITVTSAADLVLLSDEVVAPTAAALAWPGQDAQRETLEGMLLAPQGDFTVSNTYSTNQYGEVGLASGTTPLRQPTDVARPGSPEASAIAADNAARAVVLDDGASTNFLSGSNSGLTPPWVSLTAPVVVGAAVTFTDPVIVDYRNNTWKLNPTSTLSAATPADNPASFSNPRTTAPAAVGGDLSIASFNVLNYFTTLGDQTASCVPYRDRAGNGVTVREGCAQRGAWSAADLQRQQDKIVAAINALDADVVGLMEIENSAALGETADEATATLVGALNSAAGTKRWAFVPSSSELPPAAEQDVITNAIIYQVDAATPVGKSRALGTQSGADQAFGNAREPIGQAFAPAGGGANVLVVVNHFKSKGSAGPWPGDADTGDGQGSSNQSRILQATAVRDWVAAIQGDTQSVALVGDFNSYGMEDPLEVLYNAGYANAADALGVKSSSYSFGGQSGSLDHVLLNEAALDRATGADIWNINSGESVALEYSRYNAHGTLFYAPDAYRSSDHDPVKVGLTADAAPVSLTLLGINDFHGRIDGNTVSVAGTFEELRAAAHGPVLALAQGDLIGASLFPSSVAKDKPTIDVFNALGLDVATVGNHEFDRGFADLKDRVMKEAKFPYIGANVYLKGTKTPAMQEYQLFEVKGMTVAVIGAVTEETPSLVTPSGIATLDFGNPVEAINRVADQLTDGDPANGEADVLIASFHEGAGEGVPGATLETELAKGGAFADIVEHTSPKVAALLGGHTHKAYAWSAPVAGTERTRPVVQSGSYGSDVGEIVLTIDPESFEVTAHTERNVARTATPKNELIAQYPRVSEVNDIVVAALAAAAEVGNTAVGEVSADITTAFSGGAFVDGVWTGGARDNRAAESTLGNLVADALLDSMSAIPNGATIGVTNAGGLRSDLWNTQAEFGTTAVPGMPDGTISFSQANAVLPFNNTMALVTLTGAQFKAVLEQQWQRLADGSTPTRAYLQLGLSKNVTYTYDESLPRDERITSVTIDGEPLDLNASYRVGTLSFLATGGDNYRAFTEGTDYVDTGLLDYEAWIDYLGENSPVAPSYSKHAVSVTGAPTAAAPGDVVTLEVSGLNLTSRGAPANTNLVASLGDTVLGSFAVTDGAATVTVTLPADAPVGAAQLVLSADPSGTRVTVPLTIEAGTAASTTTLTLGQTSFVAGAPGTVKATATVTSDAAASGTVEFVVDGTVVATATVGGGSASAQLALPGSLTTGTHQVIARYLGSDTVSASESASVAVTVKAATSRTTLLPVLPVQINGLLHSTLFAFVALDNGQAAKGTVEFREGSRVVATVQVRGGAVSTTLPKLSRGSHTFTAVFVPSDPTTVTGSTSSRARVLVLF